MGPLALLRRSKGLTQTKAAARAAIGATMLSRIEKGLLPLSNDAGRRLARIYGLTEQRLREVYAETVRLRSRLETGRVRAAGKEEWS
jgi:transcriptional regulator with XRE-family HTH domain